MSLIVKKLINQKKIKKTQLLKNLIKSIKIFKKSTFQFYKPKIKKPEPNPNRKQNRKKNEPN